jgi:hypothetical protein
LAYALRVWRYSSGSLTTAGSRSSSSFILGIIIIIIIIIIVIVFGSRGGIVLPMRVPGGEHQAGGAVLAEAAELVGLEHTDLQPDGAAMTLT